MNNSKKITRRLHQRLEEGMIDEVRRLIEQGIQPDDLIYYGLDYKYLTLYVIGKGTDREYQEVSRSYLSVLLSGTPAQVRCV